MAAKAHGKIQRAAGAPLVEDDLEVAEEVPLQLNLASDCDVIDYSNGALIISQNCRTVCLYANHHKNEMNTCFVLIILIKLNFFFAFRS